MEDERGKAAAAAAEVAEKTRLVGACTTIEALYEVIRSFGTVPGKTLEYSAEVLIERIQDVVAGTHESTLITRAYGIRDKVIELAK